MFWAGLMLQAGCEVPVSSNQSAPPIEPAVVAGGPQQEIGPNVPISWSRGPEERESGSPSRPPNIIFIVLDDLGINDLSTFGGGVAGGRVPTPHIDALAAAGVSFTQAYAGHGTCAPSRAMLMTGRYATRTGFDFTPTPAAFGPMVTRLGNQLDNNLPPYFFDEETAARNPREQVLPGSEVTVAEILKERGYHTVHIGKWHLGDTDESHPTAQGFDESLYMDSFMYLPEDHPDVVNAKLAFDPIDMTLWRIGQFANSYNRGAKFAPAGYLTDYWTDESLKVIEANQNRPFFLYLAHFAPHTPLQATREDYEAVGDITPHRLRVYAAMLRSIDRSVERIQRKLEELELERDTMIVLTSDNGGAGYLGLPDVNAPYRGWKITLFEGGIRTPLFIKWPGHIEPDTRVATPVAHIDVMPTLVAAADARIPAGLEIDGKNLLPLAQGTGEISRIDDAMFWQSGHYRVVRAGNWKLQVNGRLNKQWLFDLGADPTEQHNLAEERPEKLGELLAILDRHHANRRAPLWEAARESPVMIDKTLAERFEEGDEYIYWPN